MDGQEYIRYMQSKRDMLEVLCSDLPDVTYTISGNEMLFVFHDIVQFDSQDRIVMDRIKAIVGNMVYENMLDEVHEFLVTNEGVFYQGIVDHIQASGYDMRKVIDYLVKEQHRGDSDD